MDKAARRFASWVLAIHVIVLALLVVIVLVASHGSYTTARRQALDQVRVRQELLAAQTARGIESFYRGILDDLAMAQRAEAMKLNVGALIWEQLSGKASSLFELDLQTRNVLNVFSDSPDQPTPPARERFSKIEPGVTVTTQGVLAAAATRDRMFVAIIPVQAIESRFLNDLNQSENMGSMLLDERLRVVSAEERGLTGMDMTGEQIDPRVKVMTEQYVKRSQRGTREFLEPMTLRDVSLAPAIVTVQPVDLPDGKKWWLAVSSNLSEVEQFVGGFFRRTIIGAGLVILAMTAVLLSTSVQMIRGRLRLERMQTELITRELAQAREIQLMWLPERQGNKIGIDIAAMNKPASHVSGDFYNWFELADGRAVIIVGDVTGHGLPAAFLMATTQLLVRMTIERLNDPGNTLRYVNKQLCQHVFSGQFVTMIVVVLDAATNVVEIATAGHPPPLVGDGNDFKLLEVDPQLVLAIEPDIPYRTQRLELKPGSSVLLYTDGVTDVQSPSGERLNPEGFEKCLYGRFDSAKSLLQSATDAIESFRAGREPGDDVTLVAIQLALAEAPASGPAASDQLDSKTPAATVK